MNDVDRQWDMLAKGSGAWTELHVEFHKPYLRKILAAVAARRAQLKPLNLEVYPMGPDVFRAYKETPLDKVKVVILGQDPYHSPGTADGLCFSTRKKVEYPYLKNTIPSLWQLIEALDAMFMPFPPMLEEDLTPWAQQGVMMLNRVLTVDQGTPKSHYGLGWQEFTGKTIQLIDKKDHIVWLLFGKPAQEITPFLTNSKKLVINREHPAAAAYRNGKWNHGDCFVHANNYLTENGIDPIKWIIN